MISIRSVMTSALTFVIALACVSAHALTPQEELNKAAVLAFYDTAFTKKDVDALAVFMGPQYIQHNPRVPNGLEALKGFIGYLKKTSPLHKSEIKRVIVQGDLVVLHVHSVPEPGALGSAIVDIFRLENGKIVEHWDVMQPVPEKSANDNTMF